MIAALEEAGWRYSAEPARADLIIINTCGFIAPAKEESIDAVMATRRLYPRKRILLAGCLAQRYASILSAELPEVDGVFGNRSPRRIVEMVDEVMAGGRPLFVPATSKHEVGGVAAAPLRRGRFLSFPGSAYVKIAEGCANRCTFCAIPLIRGDLASRPAEEIVAEAAVLAEGGIREIVLVAQDSASYGSDRRGEHDGGLGRLLEQLLSIGGDFWLRLLYFHPDRFDLGLLDSFAAEPRLLPYFDLPFQHASRPVLRRMGRTGSSDSYLGLVETLRSRLPFAVVRSTFLIGFPGEGSEEFEELLRFQERAELDWLGAFAYSREEGTPAYRMSVSAEKRARRGEVLRRVAAVEEAQLPITERRLDRFVGKRLDVLIEERIEGEPLAIGRAYLHAPEVDGSVVVRCANGCPEPGDRLSCDIVKRNGIDLEAVPHIGLGQTSLRAAKSRA